MTDPRQSEQDASVKPAAERKPEAEVEMVKDLDVDKSEVGQVRRFSGV